jgi:acetyltransferase-like isoleucine patch superfamily enzyme
LYDFHCNACIEVIIGNYNLIAPRVFITDSDHRVLPHARTSTSLEFTSKRVVIGDNCWIGVNAVVLKGVTVGSNSIIAANSVVTRDVAPGSVVAGIPAKKIHG